MATQQQVGEVFASYLPIIVAQVSAKTAELVSTHIDKSMGVLEGRITGALSALSQTTVSTLSQQMQGLTVAGKAPATAADGTKAKKPKNTNLWYADKIATDPEFRSHEFSKYPSQANMPIDGKKDEAAKYKIIANAIWSSLGDSIKDELKKQKEKEEKETAVPVEGSAPSHATLPSGLAPASLPTFNAPTFAAPAPAAVAAPTFAAPAFAAPTFA